MIFFSKEEKNIAVSLSFQRPLNLATIKVYLVDANFKRDVFYERELSC